MNECEWAYNFKSFKDSSWSRTYSKLKNYHGEELVIDCDEELPTEVDVFEHHDGNFVSSKFN